MQDAKTVVESELRVIERESSELAAEVHHETDRTAVIVGAAVVDSLLERLLLRTLRPHAAGTDPLFDGDAPLSTFSSRINISYQLGLIDEELTRALHLLRRIRNEFAHSVAGCELDSSPHRDRVRELVNPIKEDVYFTKWRDSFAIEGRSHTSQNFRGALFVIFSRLQFACVSAKPVAIDQVCHFAAPAK